MATASPTKGYWANIIIKHNTLIHPDHDIERRLLHQIRLQHALFAETVMFDASPTESEQPFAR
jgi:hypothetical protein